MLFRTRSLVYYLVVCMVSAPVWAQAVTEKPLTVQQHRMKQCNAQAVGKTGDQRKAYMSQCLRGEAPAKALTPQQQRMKDCNAKATSQSLTGGPRKAFMSQCLKSGDAH